LLEKVTAIVEQKYMSVVENIRKLIPFHQLSSLQQQIFTAYFCEIRFPEIATHDTNAGASGMPTQGTDNHAL
jgi:hypothetical protein